MLAAENLGISYNGRRLFGGLNFTLRAGERFSLAGPNGAGKSTLMKIAEDLPTWTQQALITLCA